MRFAYADPPYLGCCALYEHRHEDPYGCWNLVDTHASLIAALQRDYPDGWAMSATSGSLRSLLPLCPDDTRVAAWVKPFCAFKKGIRPCYAWEPVLFRGGRNPPTEPHAPPAKGGTATTPKDFLAESITLRRGFTGAKPARFNDWVIDLLGVRPDDALDDLFPGTGGLGERLAVRFHGGTAEQGTLL